MTRPAVDDAARKARNRKRRKRQQWRKTLRNMRDWRGRNLSPIGWYFVALTTAYGVLYGALADPHGTGHGGLGFAVIGTAIGLAWGALVFAVAPPFPAALITVASLFTGLITLGPDWPASTSAALIAVVGGWLLGIHARYLTVGRRRPPETPQLVDRTKPRRPAPIRGAERTQLLFTGIGGCFMLAFLCAWFLIPQPEHVGVFSGILALALGYGVPLGWWAAMTTSHYSVGGAPAMAANYGMLFHCWAAASIHASGIILFGSMGAICIGFALRRLHEARVGRYPWRRPPKRPKRSRRARTPATPDVRVAPGEPR